MREVVVELAQKSSAKANAGLNDLKVSVKVEREGLGPKRRV